MSWRCSARSPEADEKPVEGWPNVSAARGQTVYEEALRYLEDRRLGVKRGLAPARLLWRLGILAIVAAKISKMNQKKVATAANNAFQLHNCLRSCVRSAEWARAGDRALTSWQASAALSARAGRAYHLADVWAALSVRAGAREQALKIWLKRVSVCVQARDIR